MQARVYESSVKNPTKRICFCVVFTASVLIPLAVKVPAQGDVAETDLAAASTGRTIRLGSVADGHEQFDQIRLDVGMEQAAEKATGAVHLVEVRERRRVRIVAGDSLRQEQLLLLSD